MEVVEMVGFVGGLRRMVLESGLVKWWEEEDGIGTLEIVLIAAVLIIVALLFKDWIINFLSDLMGSAEDRAKSIFD
jgi:preprotein translocase subunit Sec61beta